MRRRIVLAHTLTRFPGFARRSGGSDGVSCSPSPLFRPFFSSGTPPSLFPSNPTPGSRSLFPRHRRRAKGSEASSPSSFSSRAFFSPFSRTVAAHERASGSEYGTRAPLATVDDLALSSRPRGVASDPSGVRSKASRIAYRESIVR